jgi:hypothetical protein
MVRITREKLYRRYGRFAWQWLYTVHAPDSAGTPTMAGEGVGWARDAAKDAIRDGRATGPVVEMWDKKHPWK